MPGRRASGSAHTSADRAQGLLVNRFFVSHSKDLDPDETMGLIDRLCRETDYPEYQCWFRWESDAVVFRTAGRFSTTPRATTGPQSASWSAPASWVTAPVVQRQDRDSLSVGCRSRSHPDRCVPRGPQTRGPTPTVDIEASQT